MKDSIGCIDYGNNNFWEVMTQDGIISFVSHEDDEDLSIAEFFDELDPTHFASVVKQLAVLLAMRENPELPLNDECPMCGYETSDPNHFSACKAQDREP